MGYFAVTTVTSDTPTAASGIVQFTVADPSMLPAVPFSAWTYPQRRNDTSGVTRAKQAQKIDVTAVNGSLVTATLGTDTPGKAISFADIIDASAFVMPGTIRLGSGTLATMADTQPPRVFDVLDGTPAAPITTLGPTVRLSRIDAIPFSTLPFPGVAGKDATLAVYSLSLQGSDQQSSGIWAVSYATQTSIHGTTSYTDACPVNAIGMSEHGYGIGGYFEGRTGSGANIAPGLGLANGVEIRATNCRWADYIYGGSGAPEIMGIWNNCLTDGHGSYKSGVARAIASGDGLAIWSHGDYYLPGSVYLATWTDASSAITSIDMRGSHLNGIDSSNGSFSGYVARLLSAQPAQIFVGASGANDSGIVMNAATGHNTGLTYMLNSATKFTVELDSSGDWLIFDQTHLSIPLEVDASGHTHVGATGLNLGFYGHTPSALQTGVAVTAAGIHAALVALGLITA